MMLMNIIVYLIINIHVLQTEFAKGIQCNMDDEHLTSIEETLSDVEEELT